MFKQVFEHLKTCPSTENLSNLFYLSLCPIAFVKGYLFALLFNWTIDEHMSPIEECMSFMICEVWTNSINEPHNVLKSCLRKMLGEELSEFVPLTIGWPC